MYFEKGQIVYSPSDLTRFLESPFASWIDRLYLKHPDRVTPDERDDELQLYADAGISHEAKFIIRDYNEVHCVSTWQAAEWLRRIQASSRVAYCPRLPKTSKHAVDPAPVSKGTEAAQRRRLLADQLTRIPNFELAAIFTLHTN